MADTLEEAALRKRHGKHYTPTLLAEFLADRLLANLDPRRLHLRVLDPACGDGELLFAVDRCVKRSRPDVTVELVGYDIDPAAIILARERAQALSIPATLETADFLLAVEDLDRQSFDGIITNPPYVRTQQLGGEVAQVLAEKYGLTGRVDLTHPFVSVAPSLLRTGGVLALLCSNRFLSTKAGSNVRKVFRRALQPMELFDLGDTKLFGAAVLPAVILAKRSDETSPSQEATYVSVYETKGSEAHGDLWTSLRERLPGVVEWDNRVFEVKSGTLEQGLDGTAPWRMGGTDEEVWLEGIQRGTWRTFSSVAKIRVGIKTTADSVFIRRDWDELSFDQRPEPDLLLPLTTHHNAARWLSQPGSLSVLYPYRQDVDRRSLVDMDDYPRARAYFDAHKERLAGRKYVVDGGREWYEIWVPQRPSQWQRAKIVFPDISEWPRFALDTSGAVVNGDCYWISTDEIGSDALALLMLGVANSSTAVRFYDHVCGNKLYAGRRRWISQYVGQFPIPQPETSPAQSIVALVRQIVGREIEPSGEVQSQLDDLVAAAFAIEVESELEPDRLF
jgi:adenine-specific DNA-methyltransferase